MGQQSGLISLRKINKAWTCFKRTGMIDADRVPISHVSGSFQLDRIVHEVITFSRGALRRVVMCTTHVKFMACIETHELCLFE